MAENEEEDVKLYIVKAIHDYEGYDIVGIYDDLNIANQIKEKALEREVCGDAVEVDEYKLNETTNEPLYMIDLESENES